MRISQSERIVWLCEELRLDYALKLYNRRSDNKLAPDEYMALRPLAFSPHENGAVKKARAMIECRGGL